jgi:hypothetical protein
MGVVRDEKLTPEARRRALEYLSRAGATTPSLLALYDPTPDPQMRGRLNLYLFAPGRQGSDRQAGLDRAQ